MYLRPLSSYYQRISQSLVFTSFPNLAIRLIAFAKPHQLLLAKPQNFPNSKHSLYFEKGVGCVWVQISSQGMTIKEGRRRDYNNFSLRMSSSLYKKMGMFCCRNLFRIFSLNSVIVLLWVMRVYMVWMKGKKVTLKIIQTENFASTSWNGLSRKALTKCSLILDSSASNMCFSYAFFTGTFTRELLAS